MKYRFAATWAAAWPNSDVGGLADYTSVGSGVGQWLGNRLSQLPLEILGNGLSMVSR